MTEIVDDVDPSYEEVSSNHSSFLYDVVEEDVPSYEVALNYHANGVSYDEGVHVDVCVGVYVDVYVGDDVDVNLPSYEPDLMSDLPNSSCYGEDNAAALVVVLVVLVVLVVVLSDGKREVVQTVVVQVGIPSCEPLVVVDRNEEVVVDNANHNHNAGHDLLHRVLFLTCLVELLARQVASSKMTTAKQDHISIYYLKVVENHALSSSSSNMNSLWYLPWYFPELSQSLYF